jgi:hypothetical protein
MFALASALAGCAASMPHPMTSSGKPEVSSEASASAAKAYIQGRMIGDGFTMRTDTPSQLVFWRYGRQLVGQGAWGYVVTFTIIEQKPGVRIVADTHMMFAVNTPQEHVYYTAYDQLYDSHRNVHKQVDEILAGLKSKEQL